MKKSFKKLVLPASIFTLAIAGAFASNMGKKILDPQPTKWVNNQCTVIDKECSFEFNVQRCTDSGMDLYHYDGTSCELPLYIRIN